MADTSVPPPDVPPPDVPPPDHASDAAIQAALQAFLNAESEAQMEEVRAAYPVVGGPAFEAAAQRLMEHAAAAGDPEAVLRLQNRLDLLYEIEATASMTPMEQAMEAFLNAIDDEEARDVYATRAEHLSTAEAARQMEELEAADAESQRFLDQRRALFRQLRADGQL